MNIYQSELEKLTREGNLRQLPRVHFDERYVVTDDGARMLNLSSNDYLGLATDVDFRKKFLAEHDVERYSFSSSSSRLLTGNFELYEQLETLLARLFGAEDALVFTSGYHMNTGILPAVATPNTLILADKLVHASLIDGIRLSTAKNIRFRHNDMQQLDMLLEKYAAEYAQIIIVTESVFSMDGDFADLKHLVRLKQTYPNVLLYVDEAHAVGVFGERGLGLAEEMNCVNDIDFLAGTFGKAIASLGAYVVCSKEVKTYLVNKMRTLIFTTALPPINVLWTKYVFEHLAEMNDRRIWLKEFSESLRNVVFDKCGMAYSQSHIVPVMMGESKVAVACALHLQKQGFYVLPIRPPTVPVGTARLRLSLNANMKKQEVDDLITCLKGMIV